MLPALLVVALALAARVAWVLLVPSKPVGDFAMYIESADHLLVHGTFDGEFVFMPGYVFLLAAVRAAGGGWLACKIFGAILGGLGAGAVYGITGRLWDRRAASVAGVAYAVWPAGIAVSSVTGTDMPAAVLIAVALYLLVRLGDTRPLAAAVAFGAAMGVAAWIRAVALPLAAGSLVYFVVRGHGFKASARNAAVACVVALCVLLPWAVRNRARYGAWFLTDSHGGLTALMGANPNSDGAYSRSLNRIFAEVTGHALLAEPHRQGDHAAYTMARDLVRFSPAFALGLVAKKAERLLAWERPILYWPLYRKGVLEGAKQNWFERWRRPIEAATDGFWLALCGLSTAGLALAGLRRRWLVWVVVPVQLGLVGIYAGFFSEVRYHLPIAMLMFPAAGGAVMAAADGVSRFAREPGGRRRALATVGLVTAAVVLMFASCAGLVHAGEALRDRHRFVVAACRIAGEARLCKWRPVRDSGEASAGGGLAGIWDGVGIGIDESPHAAETQIDLPAGTWRVGARIDVAPPGPVSGLVTVRAGDTVFATRSLDELLGASGHGTVLPFEATYVHAGGPLTVRLQVHGRINAPVRVWLSDLRMVPVPPM